MKTEPKTWTPTKIPRLYRHISGIYYARLNTGGRETWRSLRTPVLAVARAELAERLNEAAHRAALGRETAVVERLTGGAAMAIRQKELENNPSTKASTKEAHLQTLERLRRSWPEFSATELRHVTEEQCQEWGTRNARRWSATTYNMMLGMMHSLMQIAVKKGARRSNPAAGLKRLRVKSKNLSEILPGRQQFQHWVETIRKAGGRYSKNCADCVEFLAYTGVRIAEAGWIEWRHCDFQRNEIIVTGNPVDGPKNGELRRIPMVPAARLLLERLAAEREDSDPAERVLKVKVAKNAMYRAAAEAGIARITHHDLRHYFATVCIESGVDIPTVSRWLGHKDGGVLALQVYGHLRNEHSLAAAARVTFGA